MKIGSQLRIPARASSAVPTKLIYSDIDDTFTKQGNSDENAQRTRVALENAPDAVFGLSTARELAGAKNIACKLKGYPVAFLGVRNGTELYVNRDHLPADEWLMALQPSDQEPAWKAEVQQRLPGWDEGAGVEQLLKDQGYQQRPSTKPSDRRLHYWKDDTHVCLYPGAASFAMAGGNKEKAGELAQSVHAHYAALGLEVRGECVESYASYVCEVVPAAVTKTSLLEHCLGEYPSVKYVITAGDSPNDCQLFPDEVAGRPNYRIQAGEKSELSAQLAGKERLVHVEVGDLGSGLEQQFQAITSR